MRSRQSKLLVFAASISTVAIAAPVSADTLELRVVGEGGTTQVGCGPAVEVNIQGRIQNATDFGLALWSADLTDWPFSGQDITTLVLDSPGGDIDQFKRNLGLTNPSGYGGTPIDGDLIQIGGGQNTIGNAGPTLFPIGTVVTNIANGSEWVTLATGTIDTNFQLADLQINIESAFASTLATDVGPVYAVSPADVVIVGPGLTVWLPGAPDFGFTDVYSVANHDPNGSFPGGQLAIPIDPSDNAEIKNLIEPRQFGATGSNIVIRVDFSEAVVSGAVTSDPPLTGLTAFPNGNSLMITFDNPDNGVCYHFDITGTEIQVDGTIDESNCLVGDADFCICYFEGDINFDSRVNLLDRSVVVQPDNLFNTMDTPGITGPQVDINRDGIINILDRSVVALPANLFNDFTASNCP
ncbi:MAG TPA: hypothetical protein PKN33_13205 [Phycisphaerae bacterium]|nr:hypothetical protein [Phycisphaerae bacterium]